MTREYAKELLPIIQAYAEGKTIQYRRSAEGKWEDVAIGDNLSFIDPPSKYRIKPEPTYRPFKNNEECWGEMLKHQPVGWVKHRNSICIVQSVLYNGIIYFNMQGIHSLKFEEFEEFEDVKFADGTPFGIKEE